MAVLSVTAASVLASTNASTVIRREYNFGAAAMTAGLAVYLDANNVWQKLVSSAAVGNGIADLRGITLNGGGIGQPAVVCTFDTDFTPGATLTNGIAVYGSTTAGGITQGDIPTTAAYPVFLGVAKSATKLVLNICASGAVI